MLGGHAADRTRFLAALDNELAVDRDAVLVVRIDLDRLSRIRRVHGSGIARVVTRELASRMQALVAQPDHLLKYAEDAFVVIMRAPSPGGDALEELGMRVIREISAPILIPRQPPIAVGSNAGIGCAADFPESDSLRVVTAAEIAVQHANELGSRRVIVFAPSPQDDLTRLPTLFADMLPSLAAGHFQPYFQPMVSLPDRRIIGAESLIRWLHPRHGVIRPGEFIPEAERSGLIRDIDASVVKDACRVFAELPADLSLRLSVNLSAADLDVPDLPAQVSEVVLDAGLSPSGVVLEVTETAMSQDWSKSERRLAALRDHGFSLAVDDFGAGHMFLDRLNSGLFDTLKVDRSLLVAADSNDGRTMRLLEGVVALARGLGMHVVAEGIEQEEQLQRAVEAGFTRAQGFLFAPPMDAADFAGLIRSRTSL